MTFTKRIVTKTYSKRIEKTDTKFFDHLRLSKI